MIGQFLNNRYSITARLGKGAMGTVYRATDTQTGQEVALKVISSELAIEPEMLERFKREGEALRKLKHPNIVAFIDAFQHDDQYIIVMEYVSGGSLHELIKQGPLPIERARRIVLELCDALIRSHHLDIIHRDIKPENVLMDQDGTPKLADFGVARLSEGTRMTRSGTQVGTPYYMAPEAWEGKALDAQADIWSLGVMLFEMLTGQVPFGGDTGAAVMNKVLTAQPSDLKKLRAEAPASLVKIVNRMLLRDKKKRYQIMREVGVDLERSQRATTGAPTKKVKPNQWLPVVLVIGLVLIVATVWVTKNFQPPQTGPQIVETTNTPQLVNTIQPVATEGSYLILEDFENKDIKMVGFSSNSSRWKVTEAENDNGVYEVDNSTGLESPGFSFGQDEWKNYIAEYKVRYLSYGGYIGLQIRSNGTDSYIINMSTDELYLAFGSSSGWTRLNTVNPSIRPNQWYTVKIEALNDHLQVFVDNNRWIDLHDSKVIQGGLLMFAESGAYAQIDDIRVTALGEAAAATPSASQTPTFAADSSNSQVLFDETHGGLTFDLLRAATLVPDHPEYAYAGIFAEEIKKSFTLESLINGPITSEVLANNWVLILPGPNGSYTLQEAEAVLNFVQNGGGLLILGAQGGQGSQGLISGPLGVTFEGRTLASQQHLGWGPWGFNIKVDSKAGLLSSVTGITINAGDAMHVENSEDVILWTEANTWIDQNDNQVQDSNEKTGPFPIVAQIQYGQGRVIIFAGGPDSMWGSFASDNETFLMQSLEWLAGSR